MVARQDGAVYDAEYEEARAQLRLAKRDEDKARDDLTESKLLQERSERFKMRADQQATEARTRESGANRKAQETRRKIENARSQGLPKFRLDAEIQRWQAEEQRAGQDVRRHEDESRRKEREGKEVAKTIAAKNEVMLEKVRTSHSWSQRITYLASTTDARLAVLEKDEQKRQEAVQALAVTPEAVAALKSTLDSLEHSAEQTLRLNVGAEDSISLFLDQPREADHVVSHEGVTVLLVEPPLLEGLQGATLAVAESTNGASLVLSRSSEVATP